jgi:RNA polymerase sigma-70 factor (sigma-E family)
MKDGDGDGGEGRGEDGGTGRLGGDGAGGRGRGGGGSERELYAFVSARRSALFRSAYLLCGNRDEAEDLVQNTLVKVVLGWRRLRRIDNVEAYARRTLVNTYIASRRRFWHREQPYGRLPDRPAEHGGDLDTGLQVRAALDRLTPKQRAVLVLRYWDDLSVEATAAVLGMRTGTVKSHTARGLAVLRDEIRERVA